MLLEKRDIRLSQKIYIICKNPIEMGEIYKLVFTDGKEILVKDPDIDEESRIVKVEKSINGEETIYDYYPFEAIKMILFQNFDNQQLNA